MKRLVQINPVLRVSTSTGRIMQEIGQLVKANGWESHIAYSGGRDGIKPCDSHLIPVGNKISVAWHGLVTRLFDRHGLVSRGSTRRFIRQLEELKPDIIHIHNIHGYFLNYPMLFRYLKKSGIPVVWTVHDCWLYTGHCYYYSYAKCDKWKTECNHCPQQFKFPASFCRDRSRRNFLDKRAAFTSLPPEQLTIVPVSEWIAGEMRQSFFKNYPLHVIHNGIDLDTFRPYPTDEVKEKYGLQGKKIVMGIASIWCREKGWDDLLKLNNYLRRGEVLVMVGVTEEQKKKLPEEIIGITRTENVRQLAELYAAAEAFVNPTWQDNYPTVNLEAIACGTPVVTYRTGGSIEAVTPDTGIVVEQGDILGLLDAIRSIEEKGKDYYSPRCRAYAEAHFRKEDRYAEYLQLYDDILIRHNK